MPNRIFEVTGKYRKRGAVVLGRFGTRLEALAFARDAADNCVEPAGDSLVCVMAIDKAASEVLSTFYPERYEAESLDDDDDG